MRLTYRIISFVGCLGLSTVAHARDQISIVGSSTVYPFATIVAEKFGQHFSTLKIGLHMYLSLLLFCCLCVVPSTSIVCESIRNSLPQ